MEEKHALKLFKKWNISGSEKKLYDIAEIFDHDPFALDLIANIIQIFFSSNAENMPTGLKPATINYQDKSKHYQFQAISYLEHKIKNTKHLKLLFILGLFDYPVDLTVASKIWELQLNTPEELEESINYLSTSFSIILKNKPDKIDCHPLIRDYFNIKFKTHFPNAWLYYNLHLYYYYKELPEKKHNKLLPDGFEEMQPLIYAIKHGCNAKIHQEAFDDIYWKRISREKEYYLVSIEESNNDLIILSIFLEDPQENPIPHNNLRCDTRARISRTIGHRFRANGRLDEAIKHFEYALKLYYKLNDKKETSLVSKSLIEPNLTLGKINEAKKYALSAIEFDDYNYLRRVETLSLLARAFHQLGNYDLANKYFEESENLLKTSKPEKKYLYDMPGFRFCELLSENKKPIKKRVQFGLKIAREGHHPLHQGLYTILLGRIRIEEKKHQAALDIFTQAINLLIATEIKDHYPRGYLARATYYRQLSNFSLAHKDLQEVKKIAEPNNMLLHLTDYHLEKARLYIAENNLIKAKDHAEKAKQLIQETGYHRRDGELADLKKQLNL